MSKRTEDLEKQIIALRTDQLRHKLAAGTSRLRLDMKSANKHMQAVAECEKKINDRLEWLRQLGV